MNVDDKNLSSFREQIDSADKEITELILKRAEFARNIGRVKHNQDTPVYRPDREKEVYQNIISHAHQLYGDSLPLPESVLKNIYREIMSGSLFIEGGPGISFLGPVASFSHMATRSRFGSSVREFPVDTISDVFRTVEAKDEVTYGIVPVDNSSGGSIGATLDMLLVSDLKVYAEQYIRVNQNLLSYSKIPL
ncbi:MAG: chorismate mutase, partial [Spirochaetia bacterium]|nr:chorismate mutase [Spirochaetia bacterium]